MSTDGVFLDHRRALRRWKVLVAGVVVALVVVAAVQAVRTARGSAGEAVVDYFDALADRDAAAALDLVADAGPEAADAPLLRDAVLSAAQYVPPTELTITGQQARDEVTLVHVRYVVDGLEYEDTLPVQQADGFVDRTLLGRWQVVNGLRALTFGDAPAEVAVNGERVSGGGAGGPRTFVAFPGAYEVAAPEGHPVWRSQPVNVRVTAETPVVEVPMVPREEVRDRVAADVREHVDACAATGEAVPRGCPFEYPEFSDADDVSWRITRHPEVSITGPGPVVTSDEGEAVVTGDHPRWGEFEATVGFTVSGALAVSDGEVAFRPD